MKRSKLFATLVIISLFLVPLVPPPTHAAGTYTEKITVYVAGSNAVWFVTSGGINVTDPLIQSAEAITGMSTYNLTAIKSTEWTTDFQLFGPQGYNVLPVPYVPPEGAFLTVGADSFADASSAAAKFGSYLLTSFQSTSNGTGTYSFAAPLTFSKVVPSTLFKLVPLSEGGFLASITSTGFPLLPSPMITLSGQRTAAGGFVHQISVGSITAAGLDSSSRPNILNYFGTTETSIQASNKSTSSVIAYDFLDGLVVSSDSAKVVTNSSAFTSSYTLTMNPGSKLTRINATVIQQPAGLLATRVVDVGVLRTGSNMSVTITLTNLSNSTVIENAKLSDNWWQSTPGFKLVRGNSSISVTNLGAGASTSPTYVLQYTGNATQQVQLPATGVTYNYIAGTSVETGSARLNPMTISLGADEPVVVAYVSPSAPFPTTVGSNQSIKVFLKNVGTRAASSVSVGGQQIGGLAADGGSDTVTLSAAAPSLTKVNVTKTYSVSYVAPSGQTQNLTTNPVQLVFSQDSMNVGLGELALNSTVSHLPGGTGYALDLTMGLSNLGSANITSFVAMTTLPPGLSCGKTSSNLTCNGSLLTLAYSLVKPGSQEHANASFNVTQPSSFMFRPSGFVFRTSGYLLTGFSNAQPVPTGLVISKAFSPSVFFPGMTSQVTGVASNGGPFAVFNATLSSTADGFDTLKGNQTTSKTVQSLAPAANITLAYRASITATKGSQPASPAVLSFYLGGAPFTISTSPSTASFNQPLSATITTSPSSPTEGSPFTMTVTLKNPASVAVTGVDFVLPIPPGVQVSNFSNGCGCASMQKAGFSLSISSLAAGASATVQATVSASSGQTIPFQPSGKITFVYAGQTLNGTIPSGGIAVAENVTARYLLPIGMAVLALFVVAYEVRKMAAPSAPPSQK